ncbi:MAG: hypothetical protein RML12_07635 [Xanthomonadales bacterium]|nr:hypothetical protein [Xanthomonadales bacterium]
MPWPSPRLAAAALLLAAALGVALGLRLPLEAEADLVELAAVGALGDEPGLEPP